MQLDLFDIETPLTTVNVASIPQRSPFRYPGGKTWFVPTFRKWLRSEGKVACLVEPFAGGGIIGLTAAFEGLADRVVLVELDDDVAAVWQTMIYGDFQKLATMITDFKMSPENVSRVINSDVSASILDRAFQTIVRNRVNRGGILAPGCGVLKHGEDGKGLSSRWYAETLSRRIREIGQIRDRLTFIHGNVFDVIPQYMENPENSIFLDPPYTAAGKKAGSRLYRHHDLDHERLFQMLAGTNARFLLTYDDSAELRQLVSRHQFDFRLIPMRTAHHKDMKELVIGRDLTCLGVSA